MRISLSDPGVHRSSASRFSSVFFRPRVPVSTSAKPLSVLMRYAFTLKTPDPSFMRVTFAGTTLPLLRVVGVAHLRNGTDDACEEGQCHHYVAAWWQGRERLANSPDEERD